MTTATTSTANTDRADSAPARTIDLHPKEIESYHREGFLLVPRFLRDHAVEPLREEILDVLEAQGIEREGLTKAGGAADKLRQCPQYLTGSKLDALINGEATRHLAGQLIGGEANVYLPFTAVKAGGGGGQFHFHQDNNYTPHDPAIGSINIWVALVDMSPDNGCLCVVPRSHTEGQLDAVASGDGDAHQRLAAEPDAYLPVRMRAGDAIAFTRWTVHGSGPNHTHEPRVAYALQYYRSDVKYHDKNDDRWKPLAEASRDFVKPVDKLGPKK